MAVRRRLGEQGFTLVEVMLVVLILGILVSIVLGSYIYTQRRALEVVDRSNLRILRAAVIFYRAQSPTADFPSNLDNLYPEFVRSKASFIVPGTEIQYEYDPVTGEVKDPEHPDR